MTKTILERDVFDVTGEMETNQDTMRILADMGQTLCGDWSCHYSFEENARMSEQLIVVFNTLQSNLKAYDALITEAAHFSKVPA